MSSSGQWTGPADAAEPPACAPTGEPAGGRAGGTRPPFWPSPSSSRYAGVRRMRRAAAPQAWRFLSPRTRTRPVDDARSMNAHRHAERSAAGPPGPALSAHRHGRRGFAGTVPILRTTRHEHTGIARARDPVRPPPARLRAQGRGVARGRGAAMRKLVARRSDHADMRESLLSPTPAGRRFHDEFAPARSRSRSIRLRRSAGTGWLPETRQTPRTRCIFRWPRDPVGDGGCSRRRAVRRRRMWRHRPTKKHQSISRGETERTW